MKRNGSPLEEPRTRKRFFTTLPKDEELPFKLRLLKNWKLTPEASRFLKESSEPEESTLKDRTNSQLSVVLYQPTLYQQIKNYFEPEDRQ